jgi:PDZ domain
MVLIARRAALALTVLLTTLAPVRAAAQVRGNGPPLGASSGPRPLLFGFALECVRCESISPRGFPGRGPAATWHYNEYPRIADVAPGGPADRVGIRRGDVLMDVDGFSLLTDEGTQQFSALRAGDTVRLTLTRATKTFDVTLPLFRGRGGMAGGVFPRGRVMSSTPLEKRPDYTGLAGKTEIEVWSAAPVVVSTDSSGATILRIGETTVRLRPKPMKPFGKP